MGLKRLKCKILRGLAKTGCPNGLRVRFLRGTGANIGTGVYIGSNFTIACILGLEENLTLGDRVSIGPNVTVILTSDPNNSTLLDLKDRYPFICVKGKVRIENDVWLGAGSIIMPNVTIGERSVVGAGAVVLKDVPANTVVAGVPAKPIRELEIKSS